MQRWLYKYTKNELKRRRVLPLKLSAKAGPSWTKISLRSSKYTSKDHLLKVGKFDQGWRLKKWEEPSLLGTYMLLYTQYRKRERE